MEQLATNRICAAKKARGAVFTPRWIASYLTDWAIRSPSDIVLDAGAGEGVFLIEAVRRLQRLGASTEHIRQSVFAVEEDRETVQSLRQNLRRHRIDLDNVIQSSLFDIGRGLFSETLPPVDAVVGNPPYVRRWWLGDAQVHDLRTNGLSGLTDLACLFVMHAASFIRPGGRLAIILTDSWLDMNYGEAFKRGLLERFTVSAIIGFSDKVFPDALVKPVLLLAEKRPPQKNDVTKLAVLNVPKRDNADTNTALFRTAAGIKVTKLIPQEALVSSARWSEHLYAPSVYSDMAAHTSFVRLRTLASSRIGLQTFARDFFILTPERAARLGLPSDYLTPFVFSPRDCPDVPVLRENDAHRLLFTCSLDLARIAHDRVVEYIRDAETTLSKPRGRRAEVLGVNNRPRLARARRVPWYNIATEVNRRRAARILLPRRIYKRHRAWLNVDGLHSSENFIEILPENDSSARLILASVLSSFGELSLRVHAHQYGGGVFDLSPGGIRGVPLPDIRKLRKADGQRVERTLVKLEGSQEREDLDRAICDGLGIDSEMLTAVRLACRELRNGAAVVSGRAG